MRAWAEAEEVLRLATVQLADTAVVSGYVQDLRGFLDQPGIWERKAFL